MTLPERERAHQLHAAKLLVDWSTAAAAGVLLWRGHGLAAILVGFAPSIVVSLVFLSGALDRSLDRIRRSATATALASHLTADVNALRFAGLAVSWAGCWWHYAALVPAGLFVIAGGWWLAWRRAVQARRGA